MQVKPALFQVDEEKFEAILNDPRTVRYQRKEPLEERTFVPIIQVQPGTDVLELLGRYGDDDDATE
jgi:hypothetical protein